MMLDAKKRFRVLSAENNDPDFDLGLLEIVGEDEVSLNGA